MAGKRAEDIDLILYATCTPDTLIPSTACWLQKKIGATQAWALDVNAACSGFVFALSTADSFIRNGQFKTALVVGGDLLSRFTNWDDRGSCILFGDGVGAMVVERTSATDSHRIYSSHLGSDGTLWDTFHIVAGGSNLPLTPELLEQRQDKMQMKGREMFKVAVKGLAEYAAIALEHNGLTKNQLDWLIPHQANLRIIEAVAKRLEFPMEKVIVNIDRFGNTSSATVPTAFDEAVRDGRIKSGHNVLLDVFGAGLTYGSMLIRF
jgi:3-oxoacyl-[acyl-carrier-protein] synthase-3